MDVNTADTKKEECTICIQQMQTYDYTCINLNCTHKFHERCIKPWCKINPTCPNCRAKWTNIDCWCTLIANSGGGDLHRRMTKVMVYTFYQMMQLSAQCSLSKVDDAEHQRIPAVKVQRKQWCSLYPETNQTGICRQKIWVSPQGLLAIPHSRYNHPTSLTTMVIRWNEDSLH